LKFEGMLPDIISFLLSISPKYLPVNLVCGQFLLTEDIELEHFEAVGIRKRPQYGACVPVLVV
jgi:hypothetical protein